MLRNKSKNCSRTQNQEHSYSHERPSDRNHRFGPQLILVSEFFPLASDYVGSNPAITTGQIPWTHQSVSDEAAFGEMLRFAFVGKESRVSRWGWSSPGTNSANICFESERVLGVYTLYGTPVQSSRSKNVVNNNLGFGNFDAWIPEQQPSKKAKPDVDPDFSQKNCNRLGGKGNNTDSRKDNPQNGHDFARPRSKQLGTHPASFTQSAMEVGAEL